MRVALDGSLTPQDFEQRFHGTYGLYEGKLIRVVGCDEDCVSFRTAEDGASFYLYWDGNNVLDFPALTSGWRVANDGKLWYMTRQARRQYRRGICDHNTQVFSPTLANTPLSIPLLRSLFEKEPGNNLGFISRNFAVNPEGVLFAHTKRIGVLNKDTLLVSSVFQQEVADAVRRSGLPYGVIHAD